jgi:predicted nucleic acid-binding protein
VAEAATLEPSSPHRRIQAAVAARRLLRTTPTLSARDAIHVAVMQAHDVDRILTFDPGFDGIQWIVRLG